MRASNGVRLVVAIAIVALGAVVFATLGAPARSATVHSTLTIAYDASTDSFSGTVRTNGTCNAQRTVTVFERMTSKSKNVSKSSKAKAAKKSKKKKKSRNVTVGSTTTSSPTSTTWGPIANTGGSGLFFAQVAATTSSGYGDSTTCSAARSKTIRVR